VRGDKCPLARQLYLIQCPHFPRYFRDNYFAQGFLIKGIATCDSLLEVMWAKQFRQKFRPHTRQSSDSYRGTSEKNNILLWTANFYILYYNYFFLIMYLVVCRITKKEIDKCPSNTTIFNIISIQIHVSTSRGRDQTSFRTF
jgi:hypothetical protein